MYVTNELLIRDEDAILKNNDLFGHAKGALHARISVYAVDPDIQDFERPALPATVWSDRIGNTEKKKAPAAWLPKIGLNKDDLDILLNSGSEINSSLITASCKLLRKSTEIQGLLKTECVEGLNYAIKSGRFVQILHAQRQQHWLLVEGFEEISKNLVYIYDSLYSSP